MMTYTSNLRPLLLTLLLAAIAPLRAQTPIEADRCAAALKLGTDSIKIDSAEHQPAGPLPTAAGPRPESPALLPAHCRIRGRVSPYTGAKGQDYATGFELRLPDTWNGELLFQGGGGLDGRVAPAIGPIGVRSDAPPALARGFAVVSMDGGHLAKGGNDIAFAEDQQANINFAYGSIGQATRAAKYLVTALYTAAPKKTYFLGCSNGGREAMIAAERYPTEFDGIVAGDPAFNLSDATLLSHHGAATFASVAPRDDSGKPILPKALTDLEWDTVRTAVLNSCDALDGAKDGMIFNHRDCRFDPKTIQCSAGQTSGCLSPEKVAALQQAFAGPRDAAGKPIAGQWPFDAGIAEGGYRAWRIGSVGPDGRAATPLVSLSDDTLTKFFNYPQIPSVALKTIDYAAMQRQIEPTAAIADATSTDLRTFAARGAKLILFTGWSDPVFTPLDLTQWFDRLTAESAATDTPAGDYARLFMVPGMNHCGGGPALDNFDPLAAIIDWEEHGKAPDAIPATGRTFPGVSRPLCAYPKFAHYTGSGPLESESSYRCEQ